MLKIRMTIKRKRALTGILFILPWIIGFMLFFARPLILSLIYAFQEINFGDSGLEMNFIGLENFKNAFTVDPDFIRKLITAMQGIIYDVPIITIFSIFIAVILNQRFKGRAVARAVFFLPVIITSGVIISILKGDVFAQSIQQGTAQTSYVFKSSGLQDMLYNSGLNVNIINYFTTVINRIFDMAWKSGVQILLFIAGLQTIPRSSYEAADVEGATAWESFWKITFPLISPIILVNIIYTIVDTFTDYGNEMMRMIQDVSIGQLRYGYGSALAWIYFICIFLIIGIVNLVVSKKIFYMTD